MYLLSLIVRANLDDDDLGYLKLSNPSTKNRFLELSIDSDVKNSQMLSGF